MKKLSILIIILSANILYGQDIRVPYDSLQENIDYKKYYKGELFTGVTYWYWGNGVLRAEEGYINGVEHGKLICYHKNGRRSLEMYNENGRSVGKFKSWWSDGEVKNEWVFDKNGNPSNIKGY